MWQSVYFTGKDPSVTMREWLPSLQQAADWNEWSNDETFIQLARHPKSKALQKWELLDIECSHDSEDATEQTYL